MAKITLVTGGSRSGKSDFAENLFKNTDDVLYIATAIVTDKEMEDRIKRHKEKRNIHWATYEGYMDLDKILENYSQKNILLDCVTVMITNIMFDNKIDFENIKREEIDILISKIQKHFEKFILKARYLNKNLVMVTNEVGYSLVPEYKIGRIFRDIAGIINQFIAKLSNEVYLVSCGLPLKLK